MSSVLIHETQSTSSGNAPSGLQKSIHGVLYQVKLLMLFVCRGINRKYDFEIATEWDVAEKYDDVVFKYKDHGCLVYRFLQAKHKQPKLSSTEPKTTSDDLFNGRNGDFCLKKYFTSYRNIKTKPEFLGAELRDFIISTNANIDKIDHLFDELKDDDDLMDSPKSRRLKFNYNHANTILVPLLKQCSKLGELARQLAECITRNRRLDLEDKLFERYHGFLVTYVIDIKNCKISGNLFESQSLKVFRDLFLIFLTTPNEGNLRKLPGYVRLEYNKPVCKFSSTYLQDKYSHLLNELNEDEVNNFIKLKLTIAKNFKQKLVPENCDDSFLYDTVSDEEIEGFIKHFVLAVQQPNEDELNDIIANELCNSDNIINNSDTVYNVFLPKILNWLKNKQNNFLSNDECKYMLNDIILHLDCVKLTALISQHESEILKFNIKFDNNALNGIDFNSKEFKILNIINPDNITLSSIKVLQLLKLKEQKKTGYVFLELQLFLQQIACIQKAIENKKVDLLVIECDSKTNLIDFYFSLKQILPIFAGRIVFITKSLQMGSFKNDFSKNYNWIELIDKANTFKHLTNKSQDSLLAHSKIIFYGQELLLSKLINQELKSAIDADILWKLLNKETIAVGKPQAYLGDIHKNYVEQKCVHYIGIEESILKDVENFHILQDSQFHPEISHFSESKDIIILSNNKQCFTKVCNKYRNYNIHWLQQFRSYEELRKWYKNNDNDGEICKIDRYMFRKNSMIWEKTYNKVDKLRKYLNEKYDRICDLEAINDNNIIIVGKAGMGKSTYLTHLLITHFNTNDDSFKWVHKIKLLDFSTQFSKWKETVSDEEVTQFLLLSLDLNENIFGQKLFQYYFSKHEVTLFIDGFDEISPDYKSQVLSFLGSLKYKLKKLLITTRPYACQVELETELNARLISLKPFSFNDTIQFFRRSWCNNIDNINNVRFEIYLNSLLNYFYLVMNDPHSFFEVPLHVNFISVIFKDMFEKFYLSNDTQLLNSDKQIIKNSLNLVTIYEKIIELKFQEKFQYLNMDLILNKQLCESIRKDLKQKYMHLSIIELYGKAKVHQLLQHMEIDIDSILATFDEVQDKTGIIDKVVNGIPIFIHRSFSEYFAAMWFAENFSNANVKTFLRVNFFNRENRVIDFFNYMTLQNMYFISPASSEQVDDYKLLNSILTRNYKDVDRILDMENAKEVIKQKDKCGRTVLHLAMLKNITVVEKLLDSLGGEGVEFLNIKDNLFEWNAFSYAVEQNEWDIVQLLLERGIDTSEISDSQRKSVADRLNFSIYKGYYELFKLSVHYGASTGFMEFHDFKKYYRFDMRYYPINPHVIHLAALGGNLNIFKDILNAAEDVVIDFLILQYAILNDHFNILEYSINNGFNLNTKNSCGQTLLQIAVMEGKCNICKYLIDKGAILRELSERCYTILHCAVESGQLIIVKYLCSYYTELLHISDIHGDTSLHLSARNDEILKYLVGVGGKINSPNKLGQTILHSVVELGNLKIVEYLISIGADMNIANVHGDTVLHVASRLEYVEIMKYMVSMGGKINFPNKLGATILHYAAEHHNLETVEYLVSFGGDLDVADSLGDTVLHFAARNRYDDSILKYLLNKGGKINSVNSLGKTALHYVAEWGTLQTVECLINFSADLEITAYGDSVLHFAARNRNEEILKYLLNKGGNKNINVVDKQGKSLLHHATASGNLEQVQYLIFFGADLNIADDQGESVLHYAVQNRYDEIMKYLIRNGTNINAVNEEGKSVLHYAVEIGNLETVEYLICNGADLDICNINGDTGLHLAAENRNKKILQYLVEKGANMNCVNEEGKTILQYAIESDNLGLVQYLISFGAELDVADIHGDNALHLTAKNGNIHIFKYLVSVGAKINSVNEDGETILHYAVKFGNLETIEYLISLDTDMEIADVHGDTALHFAARKRNDKILRYLVNQGGKINSVNNQGKTILHYAIELGNLETVEYLICLGADLEICDVHHNSVLHFAVRITNDEILKYLVSKGCKKNAANNEGKTVLHYAAQWGNIETIDYLISKGAELEIATIHGDTVLHLAARNSDVELLKYLVSKGAKTNSTNEEGKSALHYVAKWGNLETIEYMISKGADIQITDAHCNSVLHFAAMNNNKEIVKCLVSKGGKTNSSNEEGVTVLHTAARWGDLEIVEYLINNGASLESTDVHSNTMLHFGVRNSNDEILKCLVSRGCKTNSANIDGKSILHYAVEFCYLETVQYLISNGADPNIADDHGDTALHFAAKKKNMNTLKYLMSKGGKINITNINGQTVLHYAVELGNLETIKYLISFGADLQIADVCGHTALHLAAISTNDEVLKYLVSIGGKINIANKKGETVLHYAANYCNLETIEYLIELGADLNIADVRGNTTLHFALSNVDHKILKYLLKKGGNPNIANKEGKTVLHYAANYCSLERAEDLISFGAHLDIADDNGNTAMHFGAKSVNNEMLKCLVRNGGNTNVTNRKGGTVLHYAADRGNLKTVQYLISIGADLDIADDRGITGLHYAARNRDDKILKYLVSKGGKTNVVNKIGGTILHYAANGGNLKIVQYLISIGADLNVADVYGDTALHYAARKGDDKILKYLVGKGGTTNITNKSGRTVLHYAAEFSSLKLVKYLIYFGADLEIADVHGDSMLHFAVRNRNVEIPIYFVRKGCKINVINKNGETVLHYTAKTNNLKTMEFLVSNGADLHVTDTWGDTAAHVAARKGNKDIFDFLVNKGAHKAIANNSGESILHCVIKGLFNYTDRLKYIFDKIVTIDLADDEGNTALHTAAREGAYDIFKWLLIKGASTNVVNKNGDTLLHSAVIGGSINIIRTVIYTHDGINSIDKHGNTLLNICTQLGNLIVFIFLLNHGVEVKHFDKIVIISALCDNLRIVHYCMDNCKKYNLNIASHLYEVVPKGSLEIVKYYSATIINTNVVALNGQSQMHMVVKARNYVLISYLIKNGINHEVKDNFGCTALHLAIADNCLDMVKHLVENGCNLNATDDVNQTPLHVAVYNERFDVIEYLVKKNANCNIISNKGLTAEALAYTSRNWLIRNIFE